MTTKLRHRGGLVYRRGSAAGRAGIILADSPGAYWRMDDFLDSSGNTNTLTQNGSVPTIAGLIPGDASLGRSWNGSNVNYLSAADSASLDVGDTFSLEAWIKVATDPAPGDFRCIMSKDTNAFWFGITRTSAGIQIYGVKYGVGAFVTSSNLLTVGVPYHVVVTKSGDAIKLWVDAVDRTGSIFTGVVLANNASIVQLGRSANGGATPANEVWNGTIDDVAIFPTVLSPERVLAHYSGSSGGGSPQPYPAPVLADSPRGFWTWT